MARLLALAAVASTSSGFILGVAPEKEGSYAGKVFLCGNAVEVPAAAVNDNYCDCADGSDEPSTGACSGQDATLFHCHNEGSVSKLIYASHVGDGICDCCDGSDEADLAARRPGRVAPCENRCAIEGAAENQIRLEKLSKLRTGLTKKQEIVAAALQDRAQLRGDLETLKAQLPTQKAAVDEAQRQADEKAKAEAEAKAKEEEEKRQLEAEANASVSGDHMADLNKLIEESQVLTTQRDQILAEMKAAAESAKTATAGSTEMAALNEKVDKLTLEVKELQANLEKLHARQEQLQAAIAASKNQEVPVTLEVKQAEEQKEDQKPVVSEYAKWMDGAGDTPGAIAEDPTTDAEDQEGDEPLPEETAVAAAEAEVAQEGEVSVLERAKSALRATEDKLRDLEKKLELPEDKLGFSTLMTKCLEQRDSEYLWKVCLGGSADQDHTRLGTWKGFTAPKEGLFENGYMCPGGPARSLKVVFECSDEEALHEVYEPRRCGYQATVLHPGACDEADSQALERPPVSHPKDEL